MHQIQHDILPADFGDRLERALESADRRRRTRAWSKRVLSLLPWVLLIGPIVAWRLLETTPDGVHVTIAALAWVTFLLDVGVHLDNSILSYLGLTELPTIVGLVILVALTCWLLTDPGESK
jgi:hypothetical protein